jgi:hypothetical protein
MLNLEKENYRHWCPFSESITGGDVLQSMLEQGWRFSENFCQQQWYPLRCAMTSTHSFWLQRGHHIRRMTVVSNPYVLNLIRQYRLRVVDAERLFDEQSERWREDVQAELVPTC